MMPRAVIGGLCVLPALAGMLVWPASATRAWLAAAMLWNGLPVGALGLMMMIRLIGGRWGYALAPMLEAGALTLPLSALAALPLLMLRPLLFPRPDPAHGFAVAWMALPFVELRALIWLAGLGLLLALLVGRRGNAVALSSGGLVFLALGGSLMAVDWMLALDPAFHASGFGLQALGIAFAVALAVTIRLLLTLQPERVETLAGLLIAIILIGIYLGFTGYFILWSGNLDAAPAWFRLRGSGPWGVAILLSGLLQCAGFLALLPESARRMPVLLRAVTLALLGAKAIEIAWLVLPGSGPVSLVLFVMAASGLGLLYDALQRAMLDRRMAKRRPV